MAIYKQSGDKLSLVNEERFKLEREIQSLTESNIELIFGVELVKSEFALKNFRIDSLAFDRETNSFVIFEYKRDKTFSVIDQGYAYLSLMLNNKSDFILEYNENKKTSLMRSDIDWSQSRVIFVSPSFTNYQKEAINFKDLPIELCEIKRYKGGILNFINIKPAGSTESIKTISKNSVVASSVNQEIKVYTEEDSLLSANEEIKELYEQTKNSILNLGDIEFKAKKLYIAFVSNRNIVDIRIQKNALKIWINLRKGQLDDPKGLCRDVASIGHWGNGDYEARISDDKDLEYLMSLVKQSLVKNNN